MNVNRDEPRITARQRAVLDLLVVGWSDSEIGLLMDPRIAESTVKKMLAAIARRVGFPQLNRVQLAVWWVREQGA